MRKTFIRIAAAAALLLAGDASARTDKLRIATEGAYAPWNFTNATGKLEGFEIDLAADLCRRMRAACEIVAHDWDGIIPGLIEGQYDAIIAGMSITARRREVIDFSVAYANTPDALVVSRASPLAQLPVDRTYNFDREKEAAEKAVESLKVALKGKAVGAQVSTVYANFLQTHFKDVARIRLYKTTDQHDLDLSAGRIEGVFASVGYWKPLLDSPEGREFVMVGPSFTGGIFGSGVGVGLRKADVDLKRRFDGAIEAAIRDGTVRTLSMKWFKFDVTPR